MKFKVFNYGAGNLYSIRVALEKEGVASSLTKTGAGIRESDALVLPGVGSFDQAAKALPLEQIREIIGSGKPVMGICLGLQLFYSASEEGSATGLSLLKGRVRRFPSSVKVPQIGWNTLKVRSRSELTDGVPDGSWVYFVNSFVPEATGGQVAATSSYGIEYPALVSQKNIYGAQFHPEKSGAIGRRVLQNFIRAVKK
ncbi:MAG: imidazole glycerol phosphate synthase subunit HisH [Nitrososphaerales archaeon]|jgi:imidazole glycerol-phosphate synthase subunit HisH